MRVCSNVLKSGKNFTRGPSSTAVVPFARQDLTKRWLGRIQSKASDSHSQENYMKLSALIDYYNKPSESVKEVIIYFNLFI
jgi:hypothetical protein